MVWYPTVFNVSGKNAMLLLTGEYQHVIDGKSRVLISNKLRNQIDVDEHGSNFYLVFGVNGILCLYPEKYFEQIVRAVSPGATAPDEAVAFERITILSLVVMFEAMAMYSTFLNSPKSIVIVV